VCCHSNAMVALNDRVIQRQEDSAMALRKMGYVLLTALSSAPAAHAAVDLIAIGSISGASRIFRPRKTVEAAPIRLNRCCSLAP
jgi:hypothetical protein